MENIDDHFTEFVVNLGAIMKESLDEKNSQIQRLEYEIHYLKNLLKRKTNHNGVPYYIPVSP